jgi:signal transduction histidine kinase
MKTDSLAFRLAAGAALWCTAALLVSGLVLASLFRERVEQSFDQRLAALLESLIAVSEAQPEDQVDLIRPLGEPRFSQPFSGWYWQIDNAGGVVLRSRSLWDQVLAAPAPIPGSADSGSRTQRYMAAGPDGQSLRVVARSITLPPSAATFVFRVAGNRSEVREETRRFNETLAWSLAALGLGLVAAVLLQVHYGLLPLRRLGRSLADIRLGRASRLEGRFPREVQPLVQELNALVDHNAAVVERARSQIDDLAHALKTPISVLVNEAAASHGPIAASVRRQTARMRRQLDHTLARARAAGSARVLGARTAVAPIVHDLSRTLKRIYTDRPLTIDVACDRNAVFAGERQDLEEMIGNLLDNACKWARRHVRVCVETAGERLAVRIEDDGPGLPPDSARQMLERGARLDEQVEGSGLGLAIVVDIAALYGGAIQFETPASGGLAVLLSLPGGDGPSIATGVATGGARGVARGADTA